MYNKKKKHMEQWNNFWLSILLLELLLVTSIVAFIWLRNLIAPRKIFSMEDEKHVRRLFRSFADKDQLNISTSEFHTWGAMGSEVIEGRTFKVRNPHDLSEKVMEFLRSRGHKFEKMRDGSYDRVGIPVIMLWDMSGKRYCEHIAFSQLQEKPV